MASFGSMTKSFTHSSSAGLFKFSPGEEHDLGLPEVLVINPDNYHKNISSNSLPCCQRLAVHNVSENLHYFPKFIENFIAIHILVLVSFSLPNVT
jgi:hypothetical protein